MRVKMFVPLMLAALLLWPASPLVAQTRFVLDPTFGEDGVATFEWPIEMGYQWNATNAWATKLSNGKWAVATQLRSGNGQSTQINWFEPDGTVTPASPGKGIYMPFGRSGWNGAGIAASDDGAFTLLSTVQLSSDNTDFQLYRSWQDGSDGYTGCAGTFFKLISVDMAPPNFMQDFARSLAVDADGRMIMAGMARAGQNDTRIAVARARPDCLLDNSFGVHNGRAIIHVPGAASVRVHTAVLDDRSRVLVGGGYAIESGANPDGRCFVIRLNANGSLDTGFGDEGFVRIDNMTTISGRWRCDIRHIAQDLGNRIYVQGDWSLIDDKHTRTHTLRKRIRSNGQIDSTFEYTPVPFVNTTYRGGGVAVLHLDDRVITASTNTSQPDIGELTSVSYLAASRMTNGESPPGPDFIVPERSPLSIWDSTSYHRIVQDGQDMFYVLATSGPDALTQHKTHMIRYRRESTIPPEPDDVIFQDGFQLP